jgi:hypothetical protein
MDWTLLVILGGLVGGVSEMKHITMTEPQCKSAVKLLEPLKRHLAAACVGPHGEAFGFPDVIKDDGE